MGEKNQSAAPVMKKPMPSEALTHRVLIVDDDPVISRLLERLATQEGCKTVCCVSVEEAIGGLRESRPDVILLDWHLPGMDGLTALPHFFKELPSMPIIMLTVDSNVDAAVEAIKAGAYDFLIKPVDATRLKLTLRAALTLSDERRQRRELEQTLDQVARQTSFPEILCCSKAMKSVFRLMERVLDRNLTVLIQGESGTGKELVAQAIHSRGKRRNGPFIVLNCAALPETLVESELFGHERGAFTGATTSRPGRIELANTGTLFLDEVGDMPLSIQPKFLRCLQDGKVQRIGGSEIRQSDFRLIAATNRDLLRDVMDSRFREDLFYRLAVFPIRLPPLRERPEDILLLARHFLDDAGRKNMWIEPQAAELLHSYSWPGNVRELQNLMIRLGVIVEGDRLTAALVAEHLATLDNQPASRQSADGKVHSAESPSGFSGGGLTSSAGKEQKPPPAQPVSPPPVSEVLPLAEVERKAIETALHAHKGNITEAARALSIGRATLYRYIRKHDMSNLANPEGAD